VKTGVQETNNWWKELDSGFRRNDGKNHFLTFYEFIKIAKWKMQILGENLSHFEINDLVESKTSPSRLGVTGGDEPCTIWYRVKGRGINNFWKFPDSSPSSLPCGVLKLTPVKGEGVFLTFYDFIEFAF
jgi:hypothetical protein